MRCRVILLLILSLIAFCSCRTTKVVEPAVVSHDTIYQYKCFYDSIYLRDSISQIIELKGDTVYIEKEVYKYAYRDRWHTDSIYISTQDTIVQTIEVERKLSTLQSVQMAAGKWLIIGLVVCLFGLVAKRFFS